MSARAATKVAEPAAVERTALAPRWKVLIHDDPITTFEFVETLLAQRFGKSASEARRIARETNDTGVALVTVLPLETAEFKVEQAQSLARAAGFPLTFTLEPAD